MDGLRFFFAIAVLFLISLYQSCTEMRLSVVGRHDQAQVDSVMMEVNRETHEETGKYVVNYHFRAKDDGALRDIKGDYTASRAEAEERADLAPIGVVYLESNPSIHRIVGHRQWLWVVLFFVFLSIGIAYAIWIWRQAMNDVRRLRNR